MRRDRILRKHRQPIRRVLFIHSLWRLAPPFRICEKRPTMGDARIIHIELDEATILWRNADIEQERRIAIFDLIEENTFKPLRAWEAGHQGPYRVKLAVEEGRLALEIADADGQVLELLVLALRPLPPAPVWLR